MNTMPRAPHDTRCTTCCRPAAAPYRRIVEGRIVEGCVDAIHTGHLIGASRDWHETLGAYQIRENLIAGREFRARRELKRIPRKPQPWVGTDANGRPISSSAVVS
jgi:hypothetical protein